MKRIVVLLIICFVLIASACAEPEYVSISHGGSSFDEAVEIDVNTAYFASGLPQYLTYWNYPPYLIWYKFTAETDGIYTFATETITAQASITVYSEYQEDLGGIAWGTDHGSYALPLVAGKEYRICIFNNAGFNRGDKFFFGICTPESHIDLAERETIVEATCTENGYSAVVCRFCNRELDVEVIPAKGHTEGKHETVATATCISNGVESVFCSVCGTLYMTVETDTVDHVIGQMTTPAPKQAVTSSTVLFAMCF